MNRTVTFIGGVAATVAASMVLGSSAAQAAVIQIRPADLVVIPGAPSGTTGAAQAEFLTEGIRFKIDDTNDAARGYYLIPGGTPLADVHTVQYDWIGTVAQPGMTYNIDIDGDNRPDGQLIGELAYGGKDVWLNKDAVEFAGFTTVPPDYFTTRSPCAGAVPQNGNVDGCTPPFGVGSSVHGTLDDWVRSLAQDNKTARVVSTGFIAVGLVYDGVLRSQTVGPNTYVFTNLPKPALEKCNGVDVTISGTSGNDVIAGTPGNDVIAAGNGADIVRGLGGNDIICGGDGNDKLKGGAGQDRLYGGAGRDKLRGGADKDFCDGGSGTDNATKCEKTTQI